MSVLLTLRPPPSKKNKYPLNNVKGAAAAYSLRKLKAGQQWACRIKDNSGIAGAGSECDVGFDSSGWVSMDAPTSSGMSVKQLLERNLVVNPTLAIDSNADGIADNWSINNNSVTTVVRSIDDGQKITITNANLNNSSAVLSQIVSVNAGETIQFSVEYKTDGNMNARFSFSSGVTQLNVTSNKKSIGIWTKETFTAIALPGNTTVNITFGARVDNIGDTGSVWFRNASVSKVISFVLQNSMSVDSGSGYPSGWTYSTGGHTGTITKNIELNATKLTITTPGSNTSVPYIYKEFPVVTGEIMNILSSVMVSGDVKARLQFDYWASGAFKTSFSLDINPNTDFSKASMQHTIPTFTPAVDVIRVGLKIVPNQISSTGSVWFKDVNVYRTNPSATIQTWYDQSVNGNHAIQSTVVSQPKIIGNGILVTDANGKASLQYDGIDDVLQGTTSVNNDNITYNSVFDVTDNTNNRIIVSTGGSGTNKALGFRANVNGELVLTKESTIDIARTDAMIYTTNQNLISTATYNSSTGNIYLNGTNVKTNTSAQTIDNGPVSIGKSWQSGGSSWFYKGYISEVIVFEKVISSTERQKLERNQGKAYGITVA